MRKIEVQLMRDEDAGVWVATSKNVPGLATEAETFDELVKKLQVIIPELLEANGTKLPAKQKIPFSVQTNLTAMAC